MIIDTINNLRTNYLTDAGIAQRIKTVDINDGSVIALTGGRYAMVQDGKLYMLVGDSKVISPVSGLTDEQRLAGMRVIGSAVKSKSKSKVNDALALWGTGIGISVLVLTLAFGGFKGNREGSGTRGSEYGYNTPYGESLPGYREREERYREREEQLQAISREVEKFGQVLQVIESQCEDKGGKMIGLNCMGTTR